MDEKLLGGLIALVVVLAAGALMWWSWRRRRHRDASISAYPVPVELGTARLETEVLYVASTPVAQPFERLAVEGLAFRGAGRIEVFDGGVLLRIAGEQPSYLPAERITAAGTASHAIDRGVESEGLVVITWQPLESEPGEHPVTIDSYVRARHPGDTARIIGAVNDIAAALTLRPHQESEASDD